MDELDYASHAAPLGDDNPAGPNLEYEDSYMALGRYLLPKTASMVTSDDQEEEDSTDWVSATELAENLITQTRDIRIAVSLGRCALETKGLRGASSAINLVKSLLESMWTDVHPAPEADENMDLMMRYNALGGLNAPEFISAIKSTTLVTSTTKQRVSLNTIEMAIGKKTASSDDERTQASGVVDEVFAAEDTTALVAAKNYADQAVADLKQIVEIWRNEVKSLEEARTAEDLPFETMESPQFEDLSRTFLDISRHIKERLPELELNDGDSDENGTRIAGQNITTRADAAAAITRIMEWFHHNEPSSPVPIMLDRARSMISKSFLEIVEDLGDGGIAEARKTMGQTQINTSE